MKRNQLYGMVVATALGALAATAGCGDNSVTCGPGTNAVDGVCTASSTCGAGTKADATGQCVPDGSVVCSDGTKLDTTTGLCVIDPNSCQDGTVLVAGVCQDKGRVAVDVEEGAEPNGLLVLGEDSTNPAGQFAVPAMGATVVLHGHITPFQDTNGDGQQDADSDTYVFQATGPTALRVSVDGVGGDLGGYLMVASPDDPNSTLATYQRFGVNLTGDTANRELFLPAAGIYAIAITDSRSLFLGGAFGDANTEYYASITQVALPAATAITLDANGAAALKTESIANDELKTYSIAMGNGLNTVTVTPDATATQLAPAFAVNAGSTFHISAGTSTQGGAVTSLAAGFNAAEAATIVVDPEINLGFNPEKFELDVTTSSGNALSTTGGNVTTTVRDATTPTAVADLPNMDTFFYDVAAAGDILGANLHFNLPVEGLIVDDQGAFLSFFTALDGASPEDTFTNYVGHLRHPHAGRYYLLTDDPTATAGTTTLTVTSTLTKQTPTAITTGAASASTTNGAFSGSLFTYALDRANHPWVAFEGTPSTGTLTLNAFDPNSAFGRLDTIDTSNTGTTPPDTAPALSRVVTATPSGGHVVIDDLSDSFIVQGVASAPAATYTITLPDRTFTDFGTLLATDATKTFATESLAVGGANFYFVRTDAANNLTLTVTPTGTVKPNVTMTLLDPDEGTEATFADASASTAPVTALQEPHASGWIAIKVTASIAGTYSISAKASVRKVYTVTHAAATFTSICNVGGTTDVTMSDTDEGLSADIAAPAGFTFFGEPTTTYTISTNGFLSFIPLADSHFANAPIPTAGEPDAMVAPLWTDLANIEVCSTVSGNVTTIEWLGTTFGNPFFGIPGVAVNFQVKLDKSTGVITYVYGPTEVDTGEDATIGLESFKAVSFNSVGFNTKNTLSTTQSTIFTPN